MILLLGRSRGGIVLEFGSEDIFAVFWLKSFERSCGVSGLSSAFLETALENICVLDS